MFKLKSQLPPVTLLAAGLVVLTLLTTLSGLWQYQSELPSRLLNAQTAAKTAKTTPKNPAAAGTAILSQGSAAQTSGQSGSTQNLNQAGQTAAKSIAQTGNSPAGTDTAAGQTAPPVAQPSAVTLTLSVNGQSKGTVQLAAGSNQCDVLSQALTDGIISSLDMRYDSQLGSEAVYVIDGVGDPGSVWWTYTVNGHAPPLGCSYTTAHNGDSVNWQYVKG